MIEGCEPSRAPIAGAKVTTPVAAFSVYVPAPAMATTLSASHVVVPGVNRHVTFAPLVCNSTPDAKPEVPVMVVNATGWPCSVDFVSSLAVGAGGAFTVAVIVEVTYWPSVSVA